MLPSFLDSKRYTFGQIAKLLNVHPATVWRWVLQGVRGRKLQSVLIGGRRWVFKSDLDEFLSPQATLQEEIADRRLVQAEAAGKILDAYGITTK
jgi:hypothetical protein